MADYKVTDTELTSIANAIRTKGGTQEQLEFPTGFISAVQEIPSGGGSLYLHKILLSNVGNTSSSYIYIINDSSTAFSSHEEIFNFLYKNGFTSNAKGKMFPVTGSDMGSYNNGMYAADSVSTITIQGHEGSSNSFNSTYPLRLIDTVTAYVQ